MTIKSWALAAALAVVCGCANSDSAGEQVNERCPSTPTTLTGTKPAGTSCSSADECLPVCCTCTIGTKAAQFLAAACEGGSCSIASVACSNVQTTAYCP